MVLYFRDGKGSNWASLELCRRYWYVLLRTKCFHLEKKSCNVILDIIDCC